MGAIAGTKFISHANGGRIFEIGMGPNGLRPYPYKPSLGVAALRLVGRNAKNPYLWAGAAALGAACAVAWAGPIFWSAIRDSAKEAYYKGTKPPSAGDAPR